MNSRAVKKKILLGAMFCCCIHFSNAQAGRIDTTFGINGTVSADLGEKYNYGGYPREILSQTDGSIYAIVRLNSSVNETVITKTKCSSKQLR